MYTTTHTHIHIYLQPQTYICSYVCVYIHIYTYIWIKLQTGSYNDVRTPPPQNLIVTPDNFVVKPFFWPFFASVAILEGARY